MKKTAFLLVFLMFSLCSMASGLFVLRTGSAELTKSCLNMKDITVHYYNDDFLIGSALFTPPAGAVIIDENAWAKETANYFILRFDKAQKETYLHDIKQIASVLYIQDDFIIVAADNKDVPALYPAIHGGMIRIMEEPFVPSVPKSINYQPGTMQFRDEISDMIDQVNMDTLQSFVQHLQDFGTRNAYKSGGILAQDWILGKFQSWGLNAELYDFYMPGGPASDNVIVTVTGTLYPDEYVILGAHYDSYTGGSSEPGADDNATGAAGIMEAARIMSQYSFDRSVIFATWSGEEYGLYGSEAWASEAAANGMNILGYFNIDMAGYLAAGEVIHTDIIAPSSASELKQFYKDVCAVYLPDFPTFDGALSNGDSDHTSFNNNGYQGIFPFEDVQHYSPYIHTASDIIGPSVNNFEQHMTFVKAIIANVASMASELAKPQNLAAQPGDGQVSLAWDGVEGAAFYNIYRDMQPEPYDTAMGTGYLDLTVVNGTPYSYYVTVIYAESGDESGASNTVTAIPMPPISLPFYDDFETGAPYWNRENTWGLQSDIYHSAAYALTESPAGNYTDNLDISTTLRALDFTGATSAEMSFWTRYYIETGYDFMYLEISTDGQEWEQLDSYTGVMNTWVQRAYVLDDYIGKSSVNIRFRFSSDVYVEADGMYIDDFEVIVHGVGIQDVISSNNIYIRPNPADDHVAIGIENTIPGYARVQLTDSKGLMVRTLTEKYIPAGQQELLLDVSGIQPGLYFISVETSQKKETKKLVISR
jgi:hypothetical protein